MVGVESSGAVVLALVRKSRRRERWASYRRERQCWSSWGRSGSRSTVANGGRRVVGGGSFGAREEVTTQGAVGVIPSRAAVLELVGKKRLAVDRRKWWASSRRGR